jgi:glutaredoxin-like protein
MIRIYGAYWCPDCRVATQVLDEKGISYEYINIEEVPGAAEFVEKVNNGMRSVPTIIFPDGRKLVEPSREELLTVLSG